ncbi:Stp1/IreP family PP2C-type Ser/Thr phosphatase [Virgibacillus byunsanensis]|uniref:Stp1/IreP family PP2C-type Ser/Thr phosphatase n=1 Tax=Virgibacillus byunsanensis TaxID=570945 RepID=A0ABW3LL67_9BACI
MKGKFTTDQGKVRNHNEDSGGVFYNRSQQLLAIVADGMGGHQAGDIASKMATSIIQEKWEETDSKASPEEIEEWLWNAVITMNKSIYHEANNNEACQGMGTTIVVTVCTDEFVTIAHIGDSRCYLLNENNFTQITDDHSLVNELVRSGQISKDDAEQHPRKNVLLRALGTEEQITAEIQSIGWEQGDRLLLCSDGLTNKVTDEELAELIVSDSGLEETMQQFINLANERGGEDNISLAIISHDSPAKEGENLC